MTLNPNSIIVGVVGSGAMGQGIIQVSVQGGIKTLIYDNSENGSKIGKEKVSARLERLVEKGKISSEECDKFKDLMVPCSSISELSNANFVIEAVFENLDIKREVFRSVEEVVSSDCIIASNTSSIPIASIGSGCSRKDKIAGFHFFNPVPLMKLVEVIKASSTSKNTVEKLTELGKLMTRTPVTVKDAPGFLVNFGGRAFTTEGLNIEFHKIATPPQIDAIMRDCYQFRMGPFELMDLTGIDVNFPVSQIVYEGYMQDPRIKTTPTHKAMLDAGFLGRKTGKGWYEYVENGQIGRDEDEFTTKLKPFSVALIDEDQNLKDFCVSLGLFVQKDDGDCPIVGTPIGMDATQMSIKYNVDFKRLVCIDPLGFHDKRVTMMMAPGSDKIFAEKVAAGIIASGRKVTLIEDSPGFVGQRMVAMISNLGCFMTETGLANTSDIDIAMKLALNYPKGPFEFIENFGENNILKILMQIQNITGEERYRPTTWLKRRANLGISIREN